MRTLLKPLQIYSCGAGANLGVTSYRGHSSGADLTLGNKSDQSTPRVPAHGDSQGTVSRGETSAAVLRLREKADAIRRATSARKGSYTQNKGSSRPSDGHFNDKNSQKSEKTGEQASSRGYQKSYSDSKSNSSSQQRSGPSGGSSAHRSQGSNASNKPQQPDEFWGEDHRRSYSRIEHIFGKPKYDADGKIIADLDPAHLQDKMGDFHLNHLR